MNFDDIHNTRETTFIYMYIDTGHFVRCKVILWTKNVQEKCAKASDKKSKSWIRVDTWYRSNSYAYIKSIRYGVSQKSVDLEPQYDIIIKVAPSIRIPCSVVLRLSVVLYRGYYRKVLS